MIILPYTGKKKHYDTELSYTPYEINRARVETAAYSVWIRLGVMAAKMMMESKEVESDIPVYHLFLRRQFGEIRTMQINREELMSDASVPAVGNFIRTYSTGIRLHEQQIANTFTRHEVNRDWLLGMRAGFETTVPGRINSVVTIDKKDYEFPWETSASVVTEHGELNDVFKFMELSNYVGIYITNRLFRIAANAKRNPGRPT